MQSRKNEGAEDFKDPPNASKPGKKQPHVPKKLLSETVGKLLTRELDNYFAPREQGLCCLLAVHHPPHSISSGRSDSGEHTDVTAAFPLGLGNQNFSCPNLPQRRDYRPVKSSRHRLRMLTASVKFKSSSPAEDPATNETNILPIVETLATHYGRASHMVILDPSYRFFVTKSRTGALCYKLQDDVAIVTGDPLCESDLFSNVLDEFEGYRKKHGWKLAFIGISSTFVKYARQRRWTTIEFGVERVLNPMTNDVLMEQCGKRIIVQNKQLLHPAKRNLSLRIYIPSCEQDLCLEKELSNIYNEWRRRRSGITQAFVTVYDLFDFPHLMVYIYTCSAEGKANGFVALRWIGAHQGYHLDPCVTAPEAPKGVSDLLIYSTLVFLKQEEISYLSLGFEPLGDLKEITGMPVLLDRLTRSINRRVFQKFQFKGKKAHSDKFRPDEEQESPLYVVLPTGIFDIRQVFAVLHTANIHIRKLI